MPLLHDLLALRKTFLEELKCEVIFEREFTDKLIRIVGDKKLLPSAQTGTVNIADVSNYVSSRIGWEWGKRLPGAFLQTKIKGQTAGDRFTKVVRRFLANGLALFKTIRSDDWRFELAGAKKKGKVTNPQIKTFEFFQYQHLKKIEGTFKSQPDLEAVFGIDYVVGPDIVIFREPILAATIGGRPNDKVAMASPLVTGMQLGAHAPLLHASVSCKLTIRSDRVQNARLEALNLIRTRKGRVPNIAFVTAEPLPSRIASLALGTGDVDCIYHVGLYELIEAMDATVEFGMQSLPLDETETSPIFRLLAVEPDEIEDSDIGGIEAVPTKSGLVRQRQRLHSMIDQGRLRDVSDLVLDLLI